MTHKTLKGNTNPAAWTRRDFLKTTTLSLTGIMAQNAFPARKDTPLKAKKASAKDKPNIIFLMTDQQRADALGCVNPLIKTPNLDRLAVNGIRFSQTVCNAPMCVPSRYSMMLGIYPCQTGVRTNGQFITNDKNLPAKTLPQRLNDAGYQTAGFGKTHWYGSIPKDRQDEFDYVRSRRGFETRAISQDTKSKSPYWEPGAVMMGDDDPAAYHQYMRETEDFGPGEEGVAGYVGCTSKVPAENHRDGWTTRKCLEFLDNGADPDRPLFLYVSFHVPHAGFNVPPEFENLYNISDIPDIPQPPWDHDPPGHVGPETETQWLRKRRYTMLNAWEKMTPIQRRRTTLRYWAYCSYADDMFGQVLKKLDKLGRLENSFVVFISDHGEMLGHRMHRFSKYNLYDGSVRVPLIISGAAIPEQRKGTIDNRPAELVDVLPTTLAAVGEDVPPELVGFNLLAPPGRIGSFCEFHGGGIEHIQKAPAYMWRKEDWKLILYIEGNIEHAPLAVARTKGELYNLKQDPEEWYNLYDNPRYADIRNKMTAELLMHLACALAKFPQRFNRSRLKT